MKTAEQILEEIDCVLRLYDGSLVPMRIGYRTALLDLRKWMLDGSDDDDKSASEGGIRA